MPEEIAPVAAPVAAAAPAPEPSGGGIDGMMAQLDAAAASGKPAAEVAPAPSGAKPEAAKPEVKPAPATPAAPVKPTPEEGEPDWSKAPPKWHKIYEGHKAKTADQIRSLESKIKSLETKPFEQPGDAKKLQDLEKQLDSIRNESTTYKQELAALDYTKSDEYQAQYVQRANTVYGEAVDFVSQLRVNDGTENGRPATQGDFDQIRALPLAARRKAATEMFGEYANDVLTFTRSIDEIKRDANIAVKRHSENAEKVAAERETMTRKEREAYDTHYKSSLDGVLNHPEHGKWFTADESDPELSTSLKQGFELLENITTKLDTLSPDEKAAYSAIFRARAAAMPSMIIRLNRVQSERDSFKAELEKIRGTDPGAKPTGGAAPPNTEQPRGISGAAAAFDMMPRG